MSIRQQTIPGTEAKVPAAVRAAGDAYVNEAEKTAKAKSKSDEAKAVLLAAMEKHKVTEFRDDEAVPPVIICRTERLGIKVTKLKRSTEESGDGGNELED